jgi:hypothetical protein
MNAKQAKKIRKLFDRSLIAAYRVALRNKPWYLPVRVVDILFGVKRDKIK